MQIVTVALKVSPPTKGAYSHKTSAFSLLLSIPTELYILVHTNSGDEVCCAFFPPSVVGHSTNFKEIPNQECICFPELYMRNNLGAV